MTRYTLLAAMRLSDAAFACSEATQHVRGLQQGGSLPSPTAAPALACWRVAAAGLFCRQLGQLPRKQLPRRVYLPFFVQPSGGDTVKDRAGPVKGFIVGFSVLSWRCRCQASELNGAFCASGGCHGTAAVAMAERHTCASTSRWVLA